MFILENCTCEKRAMKQVQRPTFHLFLWVWHWRADLLDISIFSQIILSIEKLPLKNSIKRSLNKLCRWSTYFLALLFSRVNFDDDHFKSCCDFLTVFKSTEMILIATSDAAALIFQLLSLLADSLKLLLLLLPRQREADEAASKRRSIRSRSTTSADAWDDDDDLVCFTATFCKFSKYTQRKWEEWCS